MIARGLFHPIKSLSKGGLLALEFETPVDKNDLVRFKDKYGRKKIMKEKNIRILQTQILLNLRNQQKKTHKNLFLEILY